MSDRFDLIVIGGGPAGVTAALRGAELGARVALVERGLLGGTCTDDGCAPTRVLAKAARLARDTAQLVDYGMTASPPRIDVARLMTETQRIVYRLHEKKQLRAHLERAGATVLEEAGPARFISEHELALDGAGALSADAFVIAAGGHARRLPFPGAELALTHSDIWRLTSLPRTLAIVGGAATGAQLASIFAAFGSRVTLLEMAPRILPGEDAAISEAVAAGFAGHGIEVVTGIGGVSGITATGARRELLYSVAADARQLTVDAVVLAVGWPGNLDALGLDAAGVETVRGYITVDDRLRTNQPHIYAAGDITGRMMLVQSATYEGRVAAQNALGRDERELRHTIVAHGGFTDPEYGSVGSIEAGARAAGHDVVVGVVGYENLDRAVIDGRPQGFCQLVVDRPSRRLLGAHVVGEQAVEVVQIAATALAAGMTIEQLAEVEYAYPTFTSVVALAARQVVHGLRMPAEEAVAWQALGGPRVAEWERRDGAILSGTPPTGRADAARG
jgi:dihydrolipoamide dehydrogenase